LAAIIVVAMLNASKITSLKAPKGTEGQKPMSTLYEQKIRQAKSWTTQGNLDSARSLLSEAKEISVLNHLDKAPIVELIGRIALREMENELELLINQERWDEARQLVAKLAQNPPSINRAVLDRRIACWLETIEANEGGRRILGAPENGRT
jgi:hypothetical protein